MPRDESITTFRSTIVFCEFAQNRIAGPAAHRRSSGPRILRKYTISNHPTDTGEHIDPIRVVARGMVGDTKPGTGDESCIGATAVRTGAALYQLLSRVDDMNIVESKVRGCALPANLYAVIADVSDGDIGDRHTRRAD